ncbi:MAG: phasin family protein [Paracoccus sp.]|nr:phasin family protein [Paracoccus sp. (in: a-proteobacteria)]
MTLRQTIQASSEKATALITKLSATSNQAVKSRENLLADLNDELIRYVDVAEAHFFPVLRKHDDTKELAVAAVKGNKDLRAALTKLSDLPKDNDDFLAAVTDLNKTFQQLVQSERKDLLPAALKVLTSEEATSVAAAMDGAVEEAETAKREERAQARREAEEAEQAAADERAAARKAKREEKAEAERQEDTAEEAARVKRAAARAQKEVERAALEGAEQVAETMQRGAAAIQDEARQVTETLTERTQKVASDSREALTIYSDAARTLAADLQSVTVSSSATAQAVSDVTSAWSEWFSKATRAQTDVSQKLLQAKSVKDVAMVQREFVATAMHNWMERRTAMLQIAQRSSEQALSPLQARIRETA